MAQFDQDQLTEEYRALVAKEVDARFAALQAGQQGATQQTQVTPQGYKVNLWGQEQTFKDDKEIQDFLEKYMQAAMENVKAPPQQTQQQAQPTKPKVDVERYVELLAKDPTEAERYKNQQMYGVDDPVTLLAQQVSQLRAAQQQQYLSSVAERFKALTPDFPTDDPQAGVALSAAAQRLNIPMTPEGLQATWNHLKVSGGYTPKGQEQGQQQQQRGGIPHLDGGTPAGYDPVFDRFASLPLDQMEAALKNIERGG